MALRVWLPLNKDIQILPVLSTSMAKESGISITEENGWFKIADASHTSSRWGAYMDFEVEPGLTYILSCDLKAGTRSAKVGFDSFAGSRSWPTDRITSSSTTGERKSYTLVTARGKYARVYFNLAPTALGDYAYFKNPTLTKITNLGISNINITEVSTSAINENTGKIGKCLTDNGTAYWAISPITLGSNCSICCWTKTSINGKMSWVLESNANATLNLYESTYYALNIGDGNGNLFKDNNGNSITCLHDGKWHHFVVTFDGTSALLYIDGEYRGKAITFRNPTTTNGRIKLGGGYNNSHSYDWNGDLNDFRIYDHCLSPLEVKEISQGLVLHYKLDEIVGDNLFLTNSVRRYAATAYDAYNFYLTENLQANQTYIIQLWDIDVYHSEKTAAQTGVWIYWGGGSVHLGNWAGTSYFTQTSSTNYHADYLTKTFTITSAQSSGSGATNPWLVLYNSVGYVAGTMNMHVGKWKIQKGVVPTGWTPAANEINNQQYTTDSSGYGNNGIITGNVTTKENDSKEGRYNTSTYIPLGSTDYITTQNPIGNPSDAITMNIWFKSNNTTPGNDYHEIFNHAISSQYFEFAIHKTGYFRQGMVINGTRYVANGGSGLLDGNWHMLTATYDGAWIKSYVDGINIVSMTQTVNGTLNGANGKFMFGHYGPNTGYHTKEAYLADARIYATALSAEDILDLYHTPANMDNLGGVHGFEMVEDTSSKELLALPWTSSYSTHNKTSISTNYNNKHEWYSNISSSSAGSDYIKINPTGKTYYYDTEISIAAGNQFYIGFERYDVNKTSRSNNACVYIVSIKPTSDIVHQRYSGTVNLATDGVNPTDTIALRILNAWSGTDSGSTKEGTIHYLSLREVTGKPQTGKIKQQGQIHTDEFVEREKQASIYENGFVGGNIIIEK